MCKFVAAQSRSTVLHNIKHCFELKERREKTVERREGRGERGEGRGERRVPNT